MKYCNSSVFVLVFLSVVSASIAVDYCSKELCPRPDQQPHIACGNTGNFGPSCPAERTVVPMTDEIIALLLEKHNTARMNTANGKVGGFSTADRMIEMSWDNELASLAEMTAKTCIFNHDKCRNTADFALAGQNLAIDSSFPEYTDVPSAVNKLFDLMFNEYVNCDMNQINNFTRGKTVDNKNIGHFTQIVWANSSKLGCAIVKFFADDRKKIYLVCDYSQGNVINWPVYTTGTPCSGCKNGCSFHYQGLCSTNEVV